MKKIFPILLLLSFPLLSCDTLLGTLTCPPDPGQYIITKDTSNQYYVRYTSASYSGEEVLYICKNNKLTLDTSTSYAQDILSSLSTSELSKFKSNPGSYSIQKNGSILFEAFDPFKNKNTKLVCKK
jgi:hypothetical protein